MSYCESMHSTFQGVKKIKLSMYFLPTGHKLKQKQDNHATNTYAFITQFATMYLCCTFHLVLYKTCQNLLKVETCFTFRLSTAKRFILLKCFTYRG